MNAGGPATASIAVVVGVDGSGRTHRLDQIAAAANGPVVRINPPLDERTFESLVRRCTEGDGPLVLVDDPHRLMVEQLLALAAIARNGVAMVMARRPTIHNGALAELEDALAGRGSLGQLPVLDLPATAALCGVGADPEIVRQVLHASAGLPAVAVELANRAVALTNPGEKLTNPGEKLTHPGEKAPPGLVARVQRKLARVDPEVARLARLLALRLALGDDVLRAASELDSAGFAPAMRVLRDVGLLAPDAEEMIPAVGEAILAELPAAERRHIHEAAGRALVAQGGDPALVAAQLRAARAFTPSAAGAYARAGDHVRFSDPVAAVEWYDDAVEAGADHVQVAAGRAEAAALLGRPVDAEQVLPPPPAARLALVDAAAAAHQGRAERSAESYMELTEPGPLLAVPALVACGRMDDARRAATGAGPAPLRLLARAAITAADDPARAVPLFIEAAEAYERTPPPLVLPDTPHALGAIIAATGGDLGAAEHLLGRALAAGVGGPVAMERHGLLLAFVRLRAGRYDTAVVELGRQQRPPLPGRERLLVTALRAGLARRGGDVARIRDAWAEIEPMLARGTVDLFCAEPVEELAVAATKVRRAIRIAPVLDALDAMSVHLGRSWQVVTGWIRLQTAIAAEDAAGAASAVEALARACVGGNRRQQAQCVAADLWARILAGDVDHDATTAAADALAAAELPWEGSRLVGQAALRTTDPAAARRLLERARELSSAEVGPAERRSDVGYGGLSEREVEVARMVLAGSTYREIGSRLFIAPKTVEHHVARMRTKLGATSRAEFVAALRGVLTSGDAASGEAASGQAGSGGVDA